MNSYLNCYFCGNELFTYNKFYQYCKCCIDHNGGQRYTIYIDDINISNLNGNLIMSISLINKGWYLECDYIEVLSGTESLSIEEAIHIMNRYEKMKAFV